MRFKATILFVFFCTVLSVFGQKDSTYRLYSSKQLEDKLHIKRVRLANKIVTKRKTIPNNFRELKNLEYLSLRPAADKYIRFKSSNDCVVYYCESSILFLPDWIIELQKLTELDLIGITKIDYNKELKKIEMLNNLQYLSIDPNEVTAEQITILCSLTKLKSLKIRSYIKPEYSELLKSSLPNCEIVIGDYADY